MSRKPFLIVLCCSVLGGCGGLHAASEWITPAPQISYSDYKGQQVDPGSVPFVLEASALTVNAPASGKGADAATCKANWQSCLQGVTVSSSPVAPDPKTYGGAQLKTAFVAKPVLGAGNVFTTSYTLASTPLATNPLLLKQVSVTSQDNLDNIVKDAAAGAATGAAFGPYGMGAGALIGIAAATGGEVHANDIVQPNFGNIAGSVCADAAAATQGYTVASLKDVQPALGLPVVVNPGLSSQFLETGADETDPHACWRPLPNSLKPNLVGVGNATAPGAGDGWFYRIVDDGSDFSDAETGIVPAHSDNSDTAIDQLNSTQFPISVCRKVTLQITWWTAIASHVADAKTPIAAAKFDVEIADPKVITSVLVPRSGSINFGPVCGAYTTNTFAGPPLGTVMTDVASGVSSVQKAQPSPSGSSGKSKSQ